MASEPIDVPANEFPVPQGTPVTRGADYQIIFTNNSRVKISPTEIALTFGYIDQIPGQSIPFVEEKVTLVFTPHHAKTLAISLEQIIKAYEQNYGHIKMDIPKTPLPMGQLQELMAAAIKKAEKE